MVKSMKNSPDFRKVLWVLLAMVVLVSMVWFVKNGNLGSGAKSYEFTGSLQGIDNSIMTVTGVYTITDTESEAQVQKPKPVNIIVTENTRITRRLITLPTQEELNKTGGRFEPDNLPFVESQVDFETLKNDAQNGSLGIFAKSERNIFNMTTFNAMEINYRAVIRP
jgi:hypothetical protein